MKHTGPTIELNDVFDFLDRMEVLQAERDRLLEIATTTDLAGKYAVELMEMRQGDWLPDDFDADGKKID